MYRAATVALGQPAITLRAMTLLVSLTSAISTSKRRVLMSTAVELRGLSVDVDTSLVLQSRNSFVHGIVASAVNEVVVLIG